MQSLLAASSCDSPADAALSSCCLGVFFEGVHFSLSLFFFCPTRAMAKQASTSSSSSLPTATFKEELLCPICYEPFKDAVTLCCGHNFCKGCVSRSWEGQPRHVCPVCKALCSPEDLRTNHTLANIVEMFLKQEKQQQRTGETSALCAVHQEEAKLFCLDDKELVCFVCQNSKQHMDHKMRPVAEMAKDYRVSVPGREVLLPVLILQKA